MDVLTIARSAMLADQARMESISHNTANVLTPGFKRHITVTTPFGIHVDQARSEPGASYKTEPVRRSIDPSPGALRHTGNHQDVAIDGGAFLEIATATGVAYTKAGSLRTDVQGRLVTLQDAPVAGVGGDIRLSGGAFTLGTNGDVSQDGRVAGRIKLVQFANPADLIPAGNGIYDIGAARVEEGKPSSRLRTGFLENSNVSSPQEMVRLTETVRHFESLQRLVQGYDETLEKTIRKLGDF